MSASGKATTAEERPVLASSAESRVNVLILDDQKHLLSVGQHECVRILTPQASLVELHA